MAVTPVGNPYVESSDRVSDYPGASEALAERIDIVGVNPFANAAARDAAIPSPVQGQMCSLNDDNKGYRYDGSEWILFSGAGPANFTNTATGTFSSGGIDYKFLTATGSLSLIVDRAGFADVLCVGAGGGGGKSKDANTAGMGGGGAGGVLNTTQAYFGVGSHTIVVGAGGITGSNGNTSRIGDYYGVGGGNGADIELAAAQATPASPGGSGGGGCFNPTAGGLGTSGQGNNGGTGTTLGGGGGGGATAVGANASGNNGGNGGAGVSNSINNVATNYGGGGGGGRYGTGTAGTGGIGGGGAGGSSSIGVAGTALTGGGGGGGTFTSPTGYTGGSGGSGIVIVRVVV